MNFPNAQYVTPLKFLFCLKVPSFFANSSLVIALQFSNFSEKDCSESNAKYLVFLLACN